MTSKLFTDKEIEEIKSFTTDDLLFQPTTQRMDLRQIGTVIGLPVYMDFGKVRNEHEKTAKTIVIQKIFTSAFGTNDRG